MSIELIRTSIYRRGSGGVIVQISVVDETEDWVTAVKIDAFGEPHWHLYRQDGTTQVFALEGTGWLCGAGVVVDNLPLHLITAGYAQAAESLSVPQALANLKDDIHRTIDTLLESERSRHR